MFVLYIAEIHQDYRSSDNLGHHVPCEDGPFLVMVSDGSMVEVVRDTSGKLMLTLDYIAKAIERMKDEDATLSPTYYHSLLVNGLDTFTGDTFLDYIIFVQNMDGSGKVISSNHTMQKTVEIPEANEKVSVLCEPYSEKIQQLDVTGTFKIPTVPPKRSKIPAHRRRYQRLTTTTKPQQQTMEIKNTETSHCTTITRRRKDAQPKKFGGMSTSRNDVTKLPEDVTEDLVGNNDMNLQSALMYKNRRKMAIPRHIMKCYGQSAVPNDQSAASTKITATPISPITKGVMPRQIPNMKRCELNPKNLYPAQGNKQSTSTWKFRLKATRPMTSALRLRSSILRKIGKSTRINRGLPPRKMFGEAIGKQINSTSLFPEVVNSEIPLEYSDETAAMIGPTKPLIPYESGIEVGEDAQNITDETPENYGTQCPKTLHGQEPKILKVASSVGGAGAEITNDAESSTSQEIYNSNATVSVSDLCLWKEILEITRIRSFFNLFDTRSECSNIALQ